MKKINYIGKVFAAVMVVAFMMVCSAFTNTRVFAVDDKPEYRMDIYPAQKSLGEIDPGSSYKGEFTIENTGKQDFEYEISFSPYSVEGEKYDPNYDKETQYTDIAKWITVNSDSGKINAGDKTKVEYVIEVPTDVHGGAQAAVIMITMRPDSQADTSAVQAIRRLGYLVFGNVDGDIIETGKILENKVPSFLFNPPIYGTSMVENTGNVYTVAKYSLQVFPLFSDEEVYTNEEEPENSVVFPETKRYNEIKWDGAPHLGIFRVRQMVKIFDEESVTEKIVFLCPIWFLFIVLLLIFCIIFWLVSRVVKRKREA